MEGFDPKLFDNLEREIILKTEAEAEKIAGRIALILERNVKEVLAENKKVATGDAIKSVKGDVQKMLWGYLIKCFIGVKYGIFIYDNTRPHWPPLAPIAKWVMDKGLTKRAKSKWIHRTGADAGWYREYQGIKLKTKYAPDEGIYTKEALRLGYLIARKISRKGTKGIKFFDIALKQAWPIIEREVSGI